MMKKGIRVIAFEDSPIDRKAGRDLIVGIIGREDIIEGLLSFYVDVDGSDATERIERAIRKSRFHDQIRLIALNGITLAGLNIVDIERLNRKLGFPVIGVTKARPNPKRLVHAIATSGVKDSRSKKMLMERLSKKLRIARHGDYYVQSIGIDKKEIGRVLPTSAELLRLAHIVASGVITGESKGRM